MFCPKCGCKVEDDDLFCPECGANIVPDETQDTDNGKRTIKKGKVFLISGLIVFFALVITFISVMAVRSRLNATTMRLFSYEGTVVLSDESGKQFEAKPDRRLVNGNILDTRNNSKAKVLLDEDRMVTLMEKSRASFRSEDKYIRLFLEKGSLFFYIERPLEDDENLDIQTSTMIIGIRGTSGYVDSDEKGNSVLYLTSGKVEVFGLDGEGNKKGSVKLIAGQKVTVISDGDNVELIVEDITEYDLPADAVLEICEDDDLLDTVVEETGWDEDILNSIADDPDQDDSDTVADAGDYVITGYDSYSTDPARLVGIWTNRDLPDDFYRDYYELREGGTGMYYFCDADGTLENYHALTWEYIPKDTPDDEGEYDGTVCITVGLESNFYWSHGMICIGSPDPVQATCYIRVEDESFVPGIVDESSSSDTGGNQVATTSCEPSDIIGSWVDTRYNYTYTINEDGTGTGPYEMSFTWSWEDGGFYFEGIDMRYYNGVLQYGESYFNDTLMVSETTYINLQRK